MSYEHCERHDADATNGCAECLTEVQAACRHDEVECLCCYKIFRLDELQSDRPVVLCDRVPWYRGEAHPRYQRTRLSVAYLEIGLRWLHDRAEELAVFEKRASFSMRTFAPMGLELGLRWLHDKAKEDTLRLSVEALAAYWARSDDPHTRCCAQSLRIILGEE